MMFQHQNEKKEGPAEPNDNLRILTQMGFDRNFASYALTECGHDIDSAMHFLFAMQSAEATPNTVDQLAALSSDVDLSIFKEIRNDDQCNGRHHVKCSAVLRIAVLLKYSQAMTASAASPAEQLLARQCVMEFCM